MSERLPLFILAGNGSYENRGCEAITRGTVKILRDFFQEPSFVALSHFHSESQYQEQRNSEYDPLIRHLCSSRPCSKCRSDPEWWKQRIMRKIFPVMAKENLYRGMLPYLPETKAVFSVGGDNYSLDYGIPRLFTDLDDVVLSKGKPLIIWGASVGPFSRMPEYEKYMTDHLNQVTSIFARETATVEYLASIGVRNNVHLMCDPAFFMEAIEPPLEKKPMILPGTIGFNASPLMARYITDGDRAEWVRLLSGILRHLHEKMGRPILLIPHVISPHDNDHQLLFDVLNSPGLESAGISLLPPNFDAAETKWVISQCDALVAARTHATIAAFSSGVPTISLAYSMKARGLNRDVFGDEERWLLNPINISPEVILKKLEEALENKETLRMKMGKYCDLAEKRKQETRKLLLSLF